MRIGALAGLAVWAAALAATFAVGEPRVAAAPLTMRGADVSSVQRTLELGGRYFDASGAARDPLDILAGIGVNYVRLRVWNNPASGTNNKAKVLAYAKIVKATARRDARPPSDIRIISVAEFESANCQIALDLVLEAELCKQLFEVAVMVAQDECGADLKLIDSRYQLP